MHPRPHDNSVSLYQSDALSWGMCCFARACCRGSLTIRSDDENQFSRVSFPGRFDEHHNLQNMKVGLHLHRAGDHSNNTVSFSSPQLDICGPPHLPKGYSCSKRSTTQTHQYMKYSSIHLLPCSIPMLPIAM